MAGFARLGSFGDITDQENYDDLKDEADVDRGIVNHGDGDGELFRLDPAPDGGRRAWLIVVSCAGISFCSNLILTFLMQGLMNEDMLKAMGLDAQGGLQVIKYYDSLSNTYAAIPALVMIYFGYKFVVLFGSVVTAVIFLTLAFTGCQEGMDGVEHFFKFLILVPGALGNSFIRLGGLIPVLEYFDKRRMKALMFLLGAKYAAQFFPLIFIAMDQEDHPKWRTLLKINCALCIPIFILGFTLKELKLTVKTEGDTKETDEAGAHKEVTLVSRLLGLSKKGVLKDRFMWSLLVIFFLFQIGLDPAYGQFPKIPPKLAQKGGSGSGSVTTSIFSSLTPTLGLFGGMFIAWIIKKFKVVDQFVEDKKTLPYYLLGLVTIIGLVFGIFCLASASSDESNLFIVTGFFYMFLYAYCMAVRDNGVPKLFDRENTRLVSSFLKMFVGIGGLISSFISGAIEDSDEDNGWRGSMRFGGGILLPTGLAVGAFMIFVFVKKGDKSCKWTQRLQGPEKKSSSSSMGSNDTKKEEKKEKREKKKAKNNNKEQLTPKADRNGYNNTYEELDNGYGAYGNEGIPSTAPQEPLPVDRKPKKQAIQEFKNETKYQEDRMEPHDMPYIGGNKPAQQQFQRQPKAWHAGNQPPPPHGSENYNPSGDVKQNPYNFYQNGQTTPSTYENVDISGRRASSNYPSSSSGHNPHSSYYSTGWPGRQSYPTGYQHSNNQSTVMTNSPNNFIFQTSQSSSVGYPAQPNSMGYTPPAYGGPAQRPGALSMISSRNQDVLY